MDTVSFLQPEVQCCPFPFIERLQKAGPVYQDPLTKFNVVTHYDDIVYVNEHPELFSNTTSMIVGKVDSPIAAEIAKRYTERGFLPMHTLVSADPPAHTGYRALVDKVFTLRFIKGLEPQITALADQLIDAFIDIGRVDFVREFGIKLPLFLIADQLGLPQKDADKFKLWSDMTIECIQPALPPERELVITDELINMQNYFWARAQEYRKTPAPKLLSLLANAEIDGRKLEGREIASIAQQLLVAGNESTTSALGLGVWMLLENPDTRMQLTANRDLMPGFVEEVLRLHSPVLHTYRQVIKDTELHGYPLKKDSIVMLTFLAGNVDESKFACPHQIDLERANVKQHLGFGNGIHYCIGNQLARGELRIAFDRLLTRLPDMRYDPDFPMPKFAPIFHIHGLDSLHLRF